MGCTGPGAEIHLCHSSSSRPHTAILFCFVLFHCATMLYIIGRQCSIASYCEVLFHSFFFLSLVSQTSGIENMCDTVQRPGHWPRPRYNQRSLLSEDHRSQGHKRQRNRVTHTAPLAAPTPGPLGQTEPTAAELKGHVIHHTLCFFSVFFSL